MHSFTTSTYYCLVLEHIDGPELLDFINSDEKYAQLDEPFLRQFWGELCKAVGWMHSVALVHRDIKLESGFFSLDSELPVELALRYPIDWRFKRGWCLALGAIGEAH
jgi:serine/threonine protein kinase